MLLLGEDGTLRFDLGNGLQCIAELTSYRLLIGRDRLETTAQGDESRTYVAGLKNFSGELNFNIRLAEQDDLFTAAQLIPSILALEGEAPIPAEFYLQRSDAPGDCPPGTNKGPGWFSGVVLLDQITLDIGNAAELIRGAGAFTGTGDLEWTVLEGLEPVPPPEPPPPPPPPPVQPYFETGRAGYTYSNDNRTVQKTQTVQSTIVAGAAKSSGKWYIEFSMANAANSTAANDWQLGLATEGNSVAYLGGYTSSLGIQNASEYHTGFTGVSIGRNPAVPSPIAIIGLAYDADAKKFWIGINGVYQAGVAFGDPVAGTNPNATWSNSLALFPALRAYNLSTVTMTIPTSWTYQPVGYASWA
jgi:hypothetical protein